MTEPREFIAAAEVAGLIGYETGQTFLNNRARLEREQGFPAPMPTSLRPLKWRRSAVLAWLEAVDGPAAMALAHAGANVILMREARQ